MYLPRLLAIVIVANAASEARVRAQSVAPSPPKAALRPVVDDYFGTKIADAYRYMEALDDPEVRSWMKGQDEFTHGVISAIPGREKLLSRLIELAESNPEEIGLLDRLQDGSLLYMKHAAGDDSVKLWWRAGGTGPERCLLDPERVELEKSNRARGKGEFTFAEPSDDGKYVLVGLMPGGAEDDNELHVIETATGKETGDVITRASAQFDAPAWLPGRHAFAYARLRELPAGAPATERQQRSRSHLHVLGTDPERDPPLFGCGVVPSIEIAPSCFGWIKARPGSRYVLGVVDTGVSPEKEYWIEEAEALGGPNPSWRKVAGFPDQVKSFALHGDDLFLLTFKDAPNFKVVRTDARHPDFASAKTVVAASDAVVRSISAAEDALYVRTSEHGADRLLRVGYGDGAVVESIAPPFAGTFTLCRADPRLPGIWFEGSSPIHPDRIYSFDPATKKTADTGLQPCGRFDDATNLEEEEVEVRSHDGVMVPLTILHAKGMERDGSHPTRLTGYGAYGHSEIVDFNRAELAWFELGGVLAFCHARGGGEFGEAWHVAGKGRTKPNTWLDLIACAQHLVDQRYTSPARLSVQGGSAGGILAGRAITERPDLFGAAIIDVGLLDMLRFETTSNGVPNIPEFGSTKTHEGFDALLAMSAYHHVKEGTPYPSVLLTTGINDPRVDPWEPAKMAARLQAATSSGKPILLRVDYGGGHGGGGGARAAFERMADSLSFLLWQAGIAEFQPRPPKESAGG